MWRCLTKAKVCRVTIPLFVFCCCAILIALPANAQRGKGKGKGGGGHHGSRHYGSHHGGQGFVDISPYGLSFGYQDDDFGIAIGPILGHGSHVYHEPAQVIVEPAPVIVDSVAVYPAAPQPEYAASAPANFDTLIPVVPAARNYQLDAETAFRQQQYQESVRLARHASLEDGQNGHLFLFGSQAAFAAGNYELSYDALAKAMDLLDESQWGYVVQNFRQLYSGSEYVRQMDRLGQFIQNNPEISFPLTIRGFHLAQLGHLNAAEADLQKALRWNPQDLVAQRLLASFSNDRLPTPTEAIAPTPAGDVDRK